MGWKAAGFVAKTVGIAAAAILGYAWLVLDTGEPNRTRDQAACDALHDADQATSEADLDRAGELFADVVAQGRQANDEELRSLTGAFEQAMRSGTTADFAIAMLDVSERCDELGD